jgi:hypothetical protein
MICHDINHARRFDRREDPTLLVCEAQVHTMPQDMKGLRRETIDANVNQGWKLLTSVDKHCVSSTISICVISESYRPKCEWNWDCDGSPRLDLFTRKSSRFLSETENKSMAPWRHDKDMTKKHKSKSKPSKHDKHTKLWGSLRKLGHSSHSLWMIFALPGFHGFQIMGSSAPQRRTTATKELTSR